MRCVCGGILAAHRRLVKAECVRHVVALLDWSLAGKLNGEFASGAQAYAGTGSRVILNSARPRHRAARRQVPCALLVGDAEVGALVAGGHSPPNPPPLEGAAVIHDLAELGRYYRRYERLMAHWRCVLPEDRMLDIRYEDVIADLEAQARRIIAYCGLPWDDRCLAFHETERPVRTASATQVRQPIYRSAVGRWRVYEENLAPLLGALGIGTAADR
jgi:uncharacterized membrane protein (UPF0136 family)